MVMCDLQEGCQNRAVQRLDVRQSPSKVRPLHGRQRLWFGNDLVGQWQFMIISVFIYYFSPGSVA